MGANIGRVCERAINNHISAVEPVPREQQQFVRIPTNRALVTRMTVELRRSRSGIIRRECRQQRRQDRGYPKGFFHRLRMARNHDRRLTASLL